MAINDSTSAEGNKSVNLPEWGAPEWETMNEYDFAENILEKMKGEDAILTCEGMDIIEKFWEEDRTTRRCALIALTKPYSWLEEQIKNNTGFAEAMMEVFECLDVEKYEVITNSLLDARRRIMCAITCRDDFDELRQKIKANQESAE